MSASLPPWAGLGALSLGGGQVPPATAVEREMRAMEAMAQGATVPLAQVPGQKVEWLWPGYLPRGMLVLVDGDPGLGKSFLTLDLAARLSSGRPLPPTDDPGAPPMDPRYDLVSGPEHPVVLATLREAALKKSNRSLKVRGPETEIQQGKGPETLAQRVAPQRVAPPVKLSPRNVLLLNAEDDLARTVQPRLVALGADLQRCHALTEVHDHFGPRPVQLPGDLWLLERCIRRHQAALVVIDPLMAFLGKVDINRDNTVRRVLYQLKQLAEKTQATILLVRHLTKKHTGGDPLYRGGGSIGIIGAARIAWLVGRHPTDEDLRVLCRLKGNLGPPPPALAFALEPAGDGVTFCWEGPVPCAPADLLAKSSVPRGRPARDPVEAKALLEQMLRKGPRLCSDVQAQAALQGVSPHALDKARRQLQIVTLGPDTLGGPKSWKFPEFPQVTK